MGALAPSRMHEKIDREFRRSAYMESFLGRGTFALSCIEIEEYKGFQPPLFFRPALA
jgi:hypothetical protein